MDLNEKVNFLFNKSRDLAVTNLHTSFPRHIYGESKQYVIGEEILLIKYHQIYHGTLFHFLMMIKTNLKNRVKRR